MPQGRAGRLKPDTWVAGGMARRPGAASLDARVRLYSRESLAAPLGSVCRFPSFSPRRLCRRLAPRSDGSRRQRDGYASSCYTHCQQVIAQMLPPNLGQAERRLVHGEPKERALHRSEIRLSGWRCVPLTLLVPIQRRSTGRRVAHGDTYRTREDYGPAEEFCPDCFGRRSLHTSTQFASPAARGPLSTRAGQGAFAGVSQRPCGVASPRPGKTNGAGKADGS